eukprot:INCI13456.9.p1 GENE.INCI13456.9~~INCI13456.9.p1  ORF type:complete len:326 (+),score=47.77 INCI13456.9:179-1156(+)
MESGGSSDAAGLPGEVGEAMDVKVTENRPASATRDDNECLREDNHSSEGILEEQESDAARQSSSAAGAIETSVPVFTLDGGSSLHGSEPPTEVILIEDEAAELQTDAEDRAESGLHSEAIDSGEENSQVSAGEGAGDDIINIEPVAALSAVISDVDRIHHRHQQQQQNNVEQNDDTAQGDEEPSAHNCSRAFADKAYHFVNWGTVAAGIGFFFAVHLQPQIIHWRFSIIFQCNVCLINCTFSDLHVTWSDVPALRLCRRPPPGLSMVQALDGLFRDCQCRSTGRHRCGHGSAGGLTVARYFPWLLGCNLVAGSESSIFLFHQGPQ